MFGGSSIVVQVGKIFYWSILKTFIASIPIFHCSSMELSIQLVQGTNYWDETTTWKLVVTCYYCSQAQTYEGIRESCHIGRFEHDQLC
jgi:hypothetical protein